MPEGSLSCSSLHTPSLSPRCDRPGIHMAALNPTLKAPHLPILSPSSWGCCTPPACSPDCGVSSPLMTLRRPCYTETQGLRPCQDTMSAARGPDGPRHSAPRPPSGGRRQAHPERLRLPFMLLDVLLNTKQPGECQLEMTFSGRSQTIARSDFLQQQSGCRGV